MKRFIKYIRRTISNKILALGIIALGFISGEVCVMILTWFLGLSLFFSKKNHIIW